MLSVFLYNVTIVAISLLAGDFLFNNFPPIEGLIPVKAVLA